MIDKENGKPKIVKRMDRPRIRAIPEAFGSGKLPRKDLKAKREDLTRTDLGFYRSWSFLMCPFVHMLDPC